MHQMTREEYKNTRKYIERKAMEIMRHEKKNDATTGVPQENYIIVQIGGRVFYLVQTNTFKVIINDFLIKAQSK